MQHYKSRENHDELSCVKEDGSADTFLKMSKIFQAGTLQDFDEKKIGLI
jgi:hypothetical protein